MTASLGAAALAAAPEPDATLASTRETLGFARPARRRLVGAALLGSLAIAATIGLMATSAWLLTRAWQRPGEAALGLAIAAVQALGLSRGFARYYERLVGHDAAFRLLGDVRLRFYDRVSTLAPAGLRAYTRAELVTRMVADVDGLQELLVRVLPPSIAACLVGAATVGGLWAVLPAAGVVTLVALATAATVVPWLADALARRTDRHEADLRATLAASFADLVDGAAELQAFGAAGAAVERVVATDAALARVARRDAWLGGLGLSLTTLLAGLAAAGNLAVGVAALRRGALPAVALGVLAVVPLAAFELVSPLPLAALSLRRARRCAARVLDVLATPSPAADPAEPLEITPGRHEVELRSVTARYPAASRATLRGVSAALSPGMLVAVVGESGAGKSTLGAVLADFLRPEEGAATLDGDDYARLAGDDVRGVVGLSEQVPHLFDTSLAANLRIARPDADDGALEAALDAVGLGPHVRELDEGLGTLVGRHGTRLSGGQRQRVAAARCLLARWPVLVLDEPTEHLTADEGAALLTALLDADPARSTLLVTHRPDDVARADEVVVLVDGAPTARGVATPDGGRPLGRRLGDAVGGD